jgi:hypothetical protein
MRVIATNNLSLAALSKYRKGRRGYVFFDSTDTKDDFSKKLELYGFERIDISRIIISGRAELRKSVTEFSGKLNSNPPHHNWWAILLSRRVAMYDFSNSLAKLFIIRKLIDLGKWDIIIIYDRSISPWKYLRNGMHQIDVHVQTIYSIKTEWTNRLNTLLPIRTVLWFLKKIVVKTRLGWKPCGIKNNFNSSPITMLSLISGNSFTRGHSIRDIYLGDLAKHFEAEGYDSLVLGQLHDKLTGDLFTSINSNKGNNFILLEHIWSLKDLLSVFKRGLQDFFGKQPDWDPFFFAGFDVREFMNASLKWELQAGYSDSLLYYKAAKIFLKKVSPALFIYPYENKCIERMLLQAVSEVSPDTKTLGYQHAVLTPKHIHMFLAEGESQSLPLPDKIVTNGHHTARMLKEAGNYPEGKIIAGTALRQSAAIPDDLMKKQPPGHIRNVLLTLAEGAEEYDKAFVFLRDIQRNNDTNKINFRIRLHPGIPYDPFKNENLTRDMTCVKDPIKSLPQSLYWADVVMYASTSVAVQAMSMGIPVIWMDLLDFWGTDPINDDSLLRWKLSSPSGWSGVISLIEQLSLNDFKLKMNEIEKFASEYFCQDPIDINTWINT